MSFNHVFLKGNVTKDPDVRYSTGPNGEQKAVAHYTVAVPKPYGYKSSDANAPTADFINCVAFGKSAEFAEKWLKRGKPIIVEGRIQTGSYVNRDGVKVYTTEVVVANHEFCDSPSGNNGGTQSQGGAASRNAAPAQETPQADSGFMEIPDGIDEELPFA